MIRKEEMEIVTSIEIALDTVEMVLKNAYISQHAVPGQFLHISVTGHTLRRPLSIANVDREQETITVLFKKIGSGTKNLAAYRPGEVINVLGPSGNGFELDNKELSTILLIGGGIGVPPLYFLGKELAKQNVNVISVLGFQSEENVFYEDKFKEIGNTHIVTNDGSYGVKGFVTDAIDNLVFDRYYSCGPLPMLQAVTKKITNTEGFLSFEERFGCGVGTCFACVVRTDDHGGYKKICKDGPVFAANEVLL